MSNRFVFFAMAVLVSFSATQVAAGITTLYDADPDNNAGTPAPDPTTVGWGITSLDGQVPAATFSNPGVTTGGAQAWILDDVGPVGNTPTGNQSNSLHYDIAAATSALMDANGFTLTMNFEQLSSGAFVGVGLNADSAPLFGQGPPDIRYGQTPDVGLQSFVYSWDSATFGTPPGAGSGTSSGATSDFWVGPNDGGMRIFFGDNTRNSVAFNLAITSVTLEVIPEPGTMALVSLSILGLVGIRRRR